MAQASAGSEDLFSGVNSAKDPKNMTDLEKKHVPVIDAPESVKKGECVTVNVEVGKLLAHPNERGHYIHFVELYADHVFLARTDFTPITTCPKFTACVSLDHDFKKLRAFAFCNLHGTWVLEKPVKVQ